MDTARTIKSSWIQQGQYSQVGYSKDNTVKVGYSKDNKVKLDTARSIHSQVGYSKDNNTVKLDTARITGYTISSGWIQQGVLDTQYCQVGYIKEYWIHNIVWLDTARSSGYTILSGWIQQGVLDTQYRQVGYSKEYWIHNTDRHGYIK